MSTPIKGKEVVDLEWNRVTSIAWPTLSAIYGLQALLAQNPITNWQIAFVIGLCLSLSVSMFLNAKKIARFAYTPTILYLILSPIFIGDKPKSSWMSIGLVAFAAVIYFSTIQNIFFAAFIVLTLCIMQTAIARLNLTSVSDNRDINFFHSYFSFIWIFVIGIASIFIRKRYLSVTQSIQTYVDNELKESVNRLNQLKQVNEKDSRNLKLHGTILNSLIYVRNMLDQNEEIAPLLGKVKNEIDALSEEGINRNKLGMPYVLNEMIENRILNRIHVSTSLSDESFDSPQVEESITEIVRELILNAEKHTGATTASLSINRLDAGMLQIQFIDDSLANLSRSEIEQELSKALNSLSLQTLLRECGGDITVSKVRNKNLRKITVIVPIINLGKELERSISHSRLAGLNDFALNFVRASALVGLLSLPGYYIVNLYTPTFIITCISVLLTFIALEFMQYKILLFLLAVCSLLIFPSISLNVESCTSLLPTPWLFNHVLAIAFLAVISVKSRLLKWIPLGIFSLQSVILPISFPEDCKNILLGSIPGIPLILVFGLSVIAIRRREVRFDHHNSTEISKIKALRSHTDRFRELALNSLLEDCRLFLHELNLHDSAEDKFLKISLQIQKIQTFLVCSEYFDSLFIQKIYEFFVKKQRIGIPGRLSLLGDNIRALDTHEDFESTITRLEEIKGNTPANLTIISNHSIEFHFDSAEIDSTISEINGMAIYYNS